MNQIKYIISIAVVIALSIALFAYKQIINQLTAENIYMSDIVNLQRDQFRDTLNTNLINWSIGNGTDMYLFVADNGNGTTSEYTIRENCAFVKDRNTSYEEIGQRASASTNWNWLLGIPYGRSEDGKYSVWTIKCK